MLEKIFTLGNIKKNHSELGNKAAHLSMLLKCKDLPKDYLRQSSAIFFCKVLKSIYAWSCKPQGVCHNYSTVLLSH